MQIVRTLIKVKVIERGRREKGAINRGYFFSQQTLCWDKFVHV
jgi:hypothetical protein